MLPSHGFIDSRLTIMKRHVFLYHKLFLESEGAYVIPSAGIILASASLRDINPQRQDLEEIVYCFYFSCLLLDAAPPCALSICQCSPFWFFLFLLHLQSLFLLPDRELCEPLLFAPKASK